MAARNQVAIPIMVRRFQPVGADYISARNQVRRDRTPGGCCRLGRAHIQCAPSVSKKSFRHAVRIFKLSKKFKNTCRLNAKGAFCPLHTSPAALSQTSSARFFDSLRAHIQCAPTARLSTGASPVPAILSAVGRHAHMPPEPGASLSRLRWLRRGVGTPPYGLYATALTARHGRTSACGPGRRRPGRCRWKTAGRRKRRRSRPAAAGCWTPRRRRRPPPGRDTAPGPPG